MTATRVPRPDELLASLESPIRRVRRELSGQVCGVMHIYGMSCSSSPQPPRAERLEASSLLLLAITSLSAQCVIQKKRREPARRSRALFRSQMRFIMDIWNYTADSALGAFGRNACCMKSHVLRGRIADRVEIRQ